MNQVLEPSLHHATSYFDVTQALLFLLYLLILVCVLWHYRWLRVKRTFSCSAPTLAVPQLFRPPIPTQEAVAGVAAALRILFC